MLSWLACQLRQLSFCCYLTKNSPRSFSWEFCRQWSRLFTKNKTNPSLAPRSFQEQSEVENSAQRLHLFSLSCRLFIFAKEGEDGARGFFHSHLFPPFLFRPVTCLASAPGHRGHGQTLKSHPVTAGHVVPCCPRNSPGLQRSCHVAGKRDPSYTFCGWPPAHPLPTQSLSYIKKNLPPPLTIERNKWLTNNNSSSSPTKARNYYNYTILD